MRELDLASLRSVRNFAQQFNREHRRLDILVCNAGIMAPPERGLTPDGLEQQFQVLYLATPHKPASCCAELMLQESTVCTVQIAT